MQLDIGRRIVLVVIAFLLVGCCFDVANAQKRRTKKSRRVTNPVTTGQQTTTSTSSAPASDPQIISTADEAASDSSTPTNTRRNSSRRSGTTPLSTEDATRDKVDKLTEQVSALNEKLSQMEQQQRTLVDLERLSRAETRAEALRVQLRDVQSKEADAQARTLQLEYELQPGVIERTLAVSGSTRPEDLREQRRRALETEKTINQAQVNQLATSRARLETAIANADAEADRLRTRIDTVLAPPANESVTTDAGAPPTGSGDTSDGRP